MKQIVKIVLIVLGVILIRNTSFGQSGKLPVTNCPLEEIQVHLSHESAFTGEIFWFKIYCTSSLYTSEELSSLAFIELVGNENTSIIRKKIGLTHGMGTGEFEIPENLPTGIYYVLAYTNWMKNFGESTFFKKEFVIINPKQPLQVIPDSSVYNSSQAGRSRNFNPDNSLKIVSDKSKYAARDLVALKISGGMAGKVLKGNLSVSVYMKEPRMIFVSKTTFVPEQVTIPERITFKPDYHGIWLSGKVLDPLGQPVSGTRLILSSPGPGTDVKTNVSDANGYFHFRLNPGTGEKDIVISMPDASTKIDLEESWWNGFRHPPDSLVLHINKNAAAFLKEKYARYQLQGRFKTGWVIKNQPVQDKPDTGVFYSKPYQRIEMNKYIALDSLREYFYELAPSVKFIQRRGEMDISVIDPQTMAFIGDRPGVFLDGILYDNYAGIAGLPAGDVDRMVILPATYYYKDLTFGGIIDIHTKRSDFNELKPLQNMTRFLFPMFNVSEWTFVPPVHTDSGLTRIPDFRYMLHWEPEIKIEPVSETEIRFYTGDIPGIFIIKVFGMTESGEIVNGEKEICVE